MAISTPAPTQVKTVSLTIDGHEVTVPEGTTIWTAAREVGIEIPVLCHDERYDPVGVCRMCVVDVGARVYAAACVRPCEDGMEVTTATPELDRRASPSSPPDALKARDRCRSRGWASDIRGFAWAPSRPCLDPEQHPALDVVVQELSGTHARSAQRSA